MYAFLCLITDIINTTTHNHNTRFNNYIGIIVPKPMTNFNRFYILFVFYKILTTLKINLLSFDNNYINYILFKHYYNTIDYIDFESFSLKLL